MRILPGRNGTKADILLYRDGNLRVALKDYSPRGFLVRNLVGRFLVRRESRAYQAVHALGPVPEIPAFLGRLGAYSLATEWVDAVPLAAAAARTGGRLSPALFDRLDRVLDRLHQGGIALGDLHHRDVLVSPEEKIFLVDLATAYSLQEHRSFLRPFRRRLFRRLADLDRIAAARLRARFTGGDPDAAVDRAGGSTAGLYRAGRRWKDWIRSGGSGSRK